MAETRTVPRTTAMVTNRLLNMYRVKGTDEFPRAVSKSEKLCSVGCLTKKRGGQMYSSSIGLKAVHIT